MSTVCSGHRGLCLPLLGLVRWPRRLGCCRRRLTPPTAPHRLPAAGGHRRLAQCSLTPADHPGRGTRWLPLPAGQHYRPPALADPGLLTARCLRHTGLTQQHATATSLLHGEEGGPREPGGGGSRERLQGNGETMGFWVKIG